jgi:hypothetical protein
MTQAKSAIPRTGPAFGFLLFFLSKRRELIYPGAGPAAAQHRGIDFLYGS